MRHLLFFALLLCPGFRAGAQADLAIPGAADLEKSVRTYKTVGDVELAIHVVVPQDHAPSDKRPAIVFFFGGGWQSGSIEQFDKQCEYFATRGMVAFEADYRVKSRHGATPDECVKDAKSAIRWVRANAGELGVDPHRIVAAGGSAGGHIAACTGVVPGWDEAGEDESVSSVPDAMVLFNPALNTTADGWGDERRGAEVVARFAGHAKELSPQHHVRKGLPPTLVLHGKADQTVPFAQAEAFAKAMKEAGNRCEVIGYGGQEHGFFNYGRGDGSSMFLATTIAADRFLASLGYVEGEPTLGK